MGQRTEVSLTAKRIVAASLASTIALSSLVVSSAVFAEGLQLEEVTVTARKREESLQDVPIAVTGITEELKAASVRSIRDMQDYAPNMYIEKNQATPGGINISIRGIAYSETDKSYDPSIGVIVDGMYLGTAAGSMLDNFDTKRIEVLRGPQGTLFGKNTTGGVINVVRGDVTGEFGGNVGVTLGSDGRQDVKGVLNLGLGDNAGIKLFANSINSDGSIYNTTINQDVSGDDRQTVGAAVRWEPSDAFNLQLHYEQNKDDGDAGAMANANGPGDLTCFALGGCEATDTGSGKDTVSTDGRNDSTSTADNIILTANWDLGSFLLTSITTNRDLEQNYTLQFDGSPAELLAFEYFNEWEQTSQELRVTSQFDNNIEFVAGVYFWDVDYAQDWFVRDLFEVVAPFPPETVGRNGQSQTTESTALFFSADWQLSDTLALTVGGRYTEEEKDFNGASSQFYTEGVDPIPDPTATYQNFKADFSEFTPKIGLTYKPSDDLMVYGSYTEGFKSGGFFGRQADFNIDPSFQPEYVETIEVGMKSTLMDGRMNLNATAFTSDYKDKQESILIPVNLTNVATVVRNAANVDISGLELEMQFQATESLKLRAAYGFLEASYKGYNADLNGDQIITNNDNLTPRDTPENTFSLGATHTIPLATGELQSYLSFRYRDEMEGDASNDPRGFQDSITNLNATVSYTWGEDQNMRVSAYGTNLTDEREAIWRTIAPLLSYRVWNQTTQYGISFDYDF